MNTQRLQDENHRYRGTGGVSQNNRACGFRPAFLDTATGTIHLSRFANHRLAPVHVLDGLPAGLIAQRDACGRVTHAKASLVSGFECSGRFYTRDEALRLAS
ncbi:MAG: hypothetical protein KDH20_19730 [Rhodocyclaceae bacterium]|nr:hypothetical protein [Rhodocyclaceae bacterium]